MAPLSWWPFLGLIFLAGIFLKVYPLAAFALMLALVSMLARWWKERSLKGVQYFRRLHYRRGFPGEILPLTVEVENRKFLPLSWLRVQDLLPAAVGPAEEQLFRATHHAELGMITSLFSLRWFERDRRTYNLLLRNRGVFRLGPAVLESGDFFGVFDQAVDDDRVDYLTVFPVPVPFRTLGLPTDDPFGDLRARKRLFENPTLPMGVREYHPEDDFRRIHWPATAHTGALQVKVYQPVSAKVLIVCLNVTTLPHYWEGTRPDLLEYLISVAASLVQHGLEDGYRVGLVSNGCLAHADQPFRVPPGRSPAQLAQLLTALAGVTPFVSGAFDRFLMAEAPRLPYGATLLIITGLVNPALEEAVLRLRHSGRRVTLISFDRKPPHPMAGVNILHLPFQSATHG